ncbi:MAG: NAD(P)/FAD-dependent oxidoreductase [Rhodothermales bacterium]
MPARPLVVIVGAGFGGLTLAKELRSTEVDVLLLDRNNYHTFQPLLYQVATAGLEPEEIAHAVRGIFHGQKNFSFRMADVTQVDWDSSAVVLDEGERIHYDYLVLAAGATTNYFGVDGAEAYSLDLKSIPLALHMRSHVIRQFEAADRALNEHPDAPLDALLTFVVVGGGPTGIETAGSLAELFHLVLRKDYPNIPIERVRVILLEATPRVLATYHERLQNYTIRKLKQRGVEVHLGDGVVRVTPDAVHLKSGKTIPTHSVIWTAGIRTDRLAERLSLEQTSGGRIVVNSDLSIPGRMNAFVIGDMSGSRDSAGRLHPQVAQLAIQGGKHVAAVIRAHASKPFVYRDLGSMATIGRNSAVVQFPNGFKATGFVAWLMWLGLHLIELIGFRNRLNVLINWTWNYFTYDRSARIILDEEHLEQSVSDRVGAA